MLDADRSRRPIPMLKVGATGHRLNKLAPGDAARLRSDLRGILRELRMGVGRKRPKLDPAIQVISALAEGADRLVAHAALEAGVGLVVPLPFRRAEYAEDFHTAPSRQEYYALLAQAHQIVELGGRRETDADRAAAYAAAGSWIAMESDLLLALWDGREADGAGGTAEVVAESQRLGRPVLWLPTAGSGLPSREPRLFLGREVVTVGAVSMAIEFADSLVSERA